MPDHLIDAPQGAVAEIVAFGADTLDGWLEAAPAAAAQWVRANRFGAKPGSHCLVPGEGGAIAQVLLGIESTRDPWAYGDLPTALPAGDYRLADGLDETAATDAALVFA